jgi:acyl transferase domain-containing protein/acyl carrier protein
MSNPIVQLVKTFQETSLERPSHLLTLSAKSQAALLKLAENYLTFLQSHPSASLADICFSANTGRSPFNHRFAILADSKEQLSERLQAFAIGQSTSGLVSGEVATSSKSGKIVFLFTGQGSQYLGMGRVLYETQPLFRRTLERCDEILRPYLETPLLEVLYPQTTETNSPIASHQSPVTSLLDETAYTQPALFALEYALAQLWQSWGIVPDAVMGHSVGEYVAACVAEVFSLEEGLKLIADRARLIQSLPQNGMMAAVFASEERVAAVLEPYAEQVAIATINGPENVVISGLKEAVQEILTQLQSQGIQARPLKVSHAFHSPLLEPILDSFKQVANSIQFKAPRLPLISNVTGKAMDEVPDAAYWCRHLREAVRFYAGMDTLAREGYETFLELGPSSTLLGMGQRCLPAGMGIWLSSLKQGQPDWSSLLTSLGTLYVRGGKINWSKFDRDYNRRRVLLPNYPFQRQRFWAASAAPSADVKPKTSLEKPEWFYAWQWKPETLKESREIPPGAIVIFGERHGVGLHLAQRLAGEQYTLYWVTPGQSFQQTPDRPEEIAIAPACPQDYDRLVAAVKAAGRPITAVIHLWNYRYSKRLEESAYSVLFLGQALLKSQLSEPIPFLLATQSAYATSRGDRLQGLTQSIGATLLQVLGQENPLLQTKVVDVVLEAFSPETLAQRLLQEIKAESSAEGIVAIRDDQRRVRTLERMDALNSQPLSSVLKDGDTYLITGGTSPVAMEIALGLVGQARLNLVLTGRQTLEMGSSRDRIHAIEQLERLGATVLYQAVDVTDAEGMAQLMETIRSRFGHLDGVIHAAGTVDHTTFKLLQKRSETVAKVLAPKVWGTQILDAVTQKEPLKFFILLSSVAASSADWGTGLGDYAAANAFLDSYAIYRTQQGGNGRSLALNFSLWRDRGMGSNLGLSVLLLVQAKGLNPLEPKKAVDAFIQALSADTPTVTHIIDLIEKQAKVPPQVSHLEPISLPSPRDRHLRHLVWEAVSQHLTLPQEQLDGQKTFQELGLDSLGAIEVIKQINLAINAQLSPTLLFEYQSPNELANYLEQQYGMSATPSVAKIHTSQESQPLIIKEQKADLQDIAIIGMACKVPGAENVNQYWNLLMEGRSAIGEVPQTRWSSQDYFDETGKTAHTTYCKRGGFINDPFDFDAMFFGISPREATVMDPQQRLFLEIAYQALQQAGYGGKHRPKDIGVFVGCGQNNYVEHFVNYQYYGALRRRLETSSWFSHLSPGDRQHLLGTLSEILEPSEILSETAAGNELNELAARVSHCLDLNGPSLSVSTACSSSLVALHLACENLRSGQMSMAIVGGVNLNLSPTPFTFLSRVQALSPTGTCYPFDSRANGMVLGEGAGALILKPLQQAIADGDFIHAVIKGSAINNDGHSQGITAPNPQGQAQAVRKAYKQFGIEPETISYIETHGTGTLLGDPIEIEGMTKAFQTFTDRREFCGVGSVKSSIGHLLSASGIISLIKVVLAMQHGQIPPTRGFEQPNPNINFAETPFYVVGEKGLVWSAKERPLRAGVNGFGFGGTNCHVILEQAPVLPTLPVTAKDSSPHLLCLSARNQPVLKQIAKQLREHLLEHPEQELAQVCLTMNNAQRELTYKAALSIGDRQELLESLAAICQETTQSNLYLGRANPQRAIPIYLLLDGSSPLAPEEVEAIANRFPIFQTAYRDCQSAWERAVNEGRALSGKAYNFAVQYALGRFLMSLALQPTNLLAEETGILVGACLSGRLSLEAAMITLARLEGAKMVIPLKDANTEELSALSWTCPLVTPSGIFRNIAPVSSLQLGVLVQKGDRLHRKGCGESISEDGVYVYLGGSLDLRERLEIGNSSTWIDCDSEDVAVNRLLGAIARLYVAGVRLNSQSLFPEGMRRVPLPTYPFERKTYKVSVVESDESSVSVVPTNRELLPAESLPVLSQEQRQLSYQALSQELGNFLPKSAS